MSVPAPTPVNRADNTTGHDKTSSRQHAGLVIVNYGKSLLVEDNNRNLQRCVARRSLAQIVTGDRVRWEPTGRQEGVINAIEPRQTILNRADGASRTRPLAANLNQIIIVAAPEPALDEFLIDKYLIAAELIGARPILVINKSDLLDCEATGELAARIKEYAGIGYQTLFSSAQQNTGIDQLSDALAHSTSILVGQSGVGKSSLIKCLLPELDITIGRLSAASGQGRHTTTTTTLYHLPRGGDLIDSPGVRDFRLEPTGADKLARGFREFRPWLGQCRFHNCRHLNEPGCAITDAVTQGAVSERRLESYRNLLQWMSQV